MSRSPDRPPEREPPATAEWALGCSTVLLVSIGLAMAVADPVRFEDWYAWEDGPPENMTALALLVGCVIVGRRGLRLQGRGARAVTFLIAFAMFFAGMEEISWGQRIFGIETPEFLARYNRQGEIGLHNIAIGGVKLNKLIFSQLLGIVTVLWLIALPPAYRRVPRLARFVDRLAVPVPRLRHVLFALGCSAPVWLIRSDLRFELSELVLVVTLVAVVVWPANRAAIERA